MCIASSFFLAHFLRPAPFLDLPRASFFQPFMRSSFVSLCLAIIFAFCAFFCDASTRALRFCDAFYVCVCDALRLCMRRSHACAFYWQHEPSLYSCEQLLAVLRLSDFSLLERCETKVYLPYFVSLSF